MQARDVPWETYQTASLISDIDLSLVRRYDKRSLDLRVSMLVEAGPAHVQAFINCLKAVSKEEGKSKTPMQAHPLMQCPSL